MNFGTFKLSGVFLSAGILLAFTFCLRADSDQPPTVLLPEHPGNLLLSMPPAPEAWELVQSRGRSDLHGTSTPVSFAVRKYLIPRKDSEGNTRDPGQLELVLTDFASQSELGASFAQRTRNMAGKPNVQILDLGGVFQGFLWEQDPRQQKVVFQGSNGGRLMLQATFEGFGKSDAAEILQSLSMDTLRELAGALPSESVTSWTFPTYEVDEMTEGMDRDSTISIHRPEIDVDFPAPPGVAVPPLPETNNE